MQELIQLLANGVIVGSIIALGAIGITLVFGILDIGSFAHGDYMTFGAYGAFGAIAASGLPFPAALVVAALATALLGIFIDVAVLRWFQNKGPDSMIIVTLGVALILRHVIYFVAGSAPRAYPIDVTTVLDLGLIRISIVQLTVVVAAVVVIVITAWFLANTSLGKSMRAVADNRDLAAVAGVNIRRVRWSTWFVSSALAGVGGTLLALSQASFNPELGWTILLMLFTASILGGLRSAYGTLAGALIVGIAMETSTWSGFFGGLDGVYKPIIAFLILIGMLMIRPQGLFGKARLV